MMQTAAVQSGTLSAAVHEALLSMGGVRKSMEVIRWIEGSYPGLFERKAIQSQLRRSAVNNPGAIKRHPGAPGFLNKVSTGMFEMYDEAKHGKYDGRGFPEGTSGTLTDSAEDLEELVDDLQEQIAASSEFAYEAHLRDYLARNLQILEPGLALWTGKVSDSVEFPVEQRRIDILAKDKEGVPVIIELKLSRGHERTLGQALYYRGKLKQILNLVRIRLIFVAAEITEELLVASGETNDVTLYSYSLTMQVQKSAHPS